MWLVPVFRAIFVVIYEPIFFLLKHVDELYTLA